MTIQHHKRNFPQIIPNQVDDAPVELSPKQRERLELLAPQAKQAITGVGKTSIEALKSIRDEGLFRGTHNDFESWLKESLQASPARASQLKAAVEEMTLLSDLLGDDNMLPTNERGYRVLHRIKDDQEKVDILKSAYLKAGNQSPSSTEISAVLEERRDPKKPIAVKRVKVPEIVALSQKVKSHIETADILSSSFGDVQALKQILNDLHRSASKRGLMPESNPPISPPENLEDIDFDPEFMDSFYDEPPEKIHEIISQTAPKMLMQLKLPSSVKKALTDKLKESMREFADSRMEKRELETV